MMVRSGKISLVALSLVALGFMSAPIVAQAQNDPPGGTEGSTISNKPVKLDLESADLYYALKLMFSQIKADFALPPDLRGTLITVRLNQPFRIALETVLKASGLPLTWKLENGVYSIIPIETDTTPGPEVGSDTPEGPEATRNIPVRLRVNNVSGIDIVAILGGKFIPWTGSGQFVGFNPFGGGGGQGGGGFGGGGQGGFGGGGLGGGGFGGGGQGGFGGGGLGGGGGGFGGGGLGGGGFGGGGGSFGGGGFGGGRGY